jgi:hypothetical protein
MLKRQGIITRRAVARRVLRRAAGIVYNSALYGFVIYCIGCVIPTPLDQAPAQMNYPPVFVTTQVTPPFGPLPDPISTGVTVSLVATDPNPDDVLSVALFEPDATAPGGMRQVVAPQTLTKQAASDMGDPNLRVGSIDLPVCFNSTDGFMFDLYAFVADRPFSSTGNRSQAPGGLTNSNHWEITCRAM